MTFREYYKDMVDRGLITTEMQGQKDVEAWNEMQLQKARDMDDRILTLWKLTAQSIPHIVSPDPMQYEKLPDYDVLCFFKRLTKFDSVRSN